MASPDTRTLPLSTPVRLHRIIRHAGWWQLWTATKDYKHGTFFELHDDGAVFVVTAREDEGDERWQVRPDE